MVSPILHGDLNALERPLTLALCPAAHDRATGPVEEHTQGDRLLVDTLYRAIVYIKGTPDQLGVSPTVFLVNLSAAQYVVRQRHPADRDSLPISRDAERRRETCTAGLLKRLAADR
jgi:hypothetical protein